jgi:hypothetical protein
MGGQSFHKKRGESANLSSLMVKVQPIEKVLDES